MILKRGDFQLSMFEQKYVDGTSQLIATQFVKNNPVWKAYNISYELAYKFIRYKIIPLAQRSISFVLLNKDEKIVGCVINMELNTLKHQKEYKNSCPDHQVDAIQEIENMDMFKKLASVDAEILNDIVKDNIPFGAGYNYYGVIDDQIVNGGLATWMFYATFYYSRQATARHFYARLTNPIAFKILRKMGAREINRYTFNEPEKGLNNYHIYLVYFCLDDLQIFREHL